MVHYHMYYVDINYQDASEHGIPYKEKYAVLDGDGGILVSNSNFPGAWVIRLPTLSDEEMRERGFEIKIVVHSDYYAKGKGKEGPKSGKWVKTLPKI